MFSDLKFAILSLTKAPGFALSIMPIMPIVALGVEFNTARFS
jgi:hypothetical protein